METFFSIIWTLTKIGLFCTFGLPFMLFGLYIVLSFMFSVVLLIGALLEQLFLFIERKIK